MMERYAKYKDSGIAWLGKIPEHWETKKLKYIKDRTKNSFVDGPFGSNLKTIHFVKDGDVYVIDSGYITSGYFDVHRDFKTITLDHFETIKRSESKTGDIIIAKIGANFGMSGILPKLDKKSVISGNSLKLSVNIFFHFVPYIHYQLLSLKANGLIDLEVKGSAQPALTMGVMSELFFASPPREEQKAIAAYLDRKTAEIDELIAQKERLIALYEEEKTAIINEAVTKGINPDVKLKPTAIDWLGDIPKHWEIKKLKYLAEIIDCKNRTPDYFDGGEYLVVRTSNVKNLKLDLDNALYTNRENFIEWTKRGIPKVGSVLFTREAPAGEATLVPKDIPLCLGQRMMSLNPKQEVLDSLFLLYFIYSNSTKTYVSLCSSGSTVSHLRVPQVYEIPVLNMSLEEQKTIAEYIEKETARIDAKIAKTKRIIELQKEYRTALISEAVTGKIKIPDLTELDQ